MDIHKSMDNWRLISTKIWIIIYGYLLFTDIHCGMSLHGYPCLDINVDIHAYMDNWRTDIKKSWISMLISVDFWKSMHGFAIDSRTRDSLLNTLMKQNLKNESKNDCWEKSHNCLGNEGEDEGREIFWYLFYIIDGPNSSQKVPPSTYQAKRTIHK